METEQVSEQDFTTIRFPPPLTYSLTSTLELAVCPNDTNVHIYNTSSNNWSIEATLKDVGVNRITTWHVSGC
jgi:hypothetical protein